MFKNAMNEPTTIDRADRPRMSAKRMLLIELVIVSALAPLAYLTLGTGRYGLSFESSYGAQCFPWRAYLVKRDAAATQASLQAGKIVTATINSWTPYVPSGTPVAKFVVATAGDRVEVTDTSIRVNGGPSLGRLEAAAVYRADTHVATKSGTPLQRRSLQTFSRTYQVALGEVFLMGASPLSQDSRYYGAVANSAITGEVVAVLW